MAGPLRIDVFAHIVPPEYGRHVVRVLQAHNDRRLAEYEIMSRRDPALTDLDARFRLMDELGKGYRQVLVMAHSGVEHEDAPVAADAARAGNEALADVARDHPDRFVGWVAQTALQDGERALEALEHAIFEQGALGVQVFTSTQGRALDHPAFEGLFALMARLDRPIWIHPNRTAEWSDFPLTEPVSKYGLHLLLGWPADTAITMCRLVYAGYLERWPHLKLITHHSGGTIPMLAGRAKLPPAPVGVSADELAERMKQEPLIYLKRFYADTANFGNPIALRAAIEFFGTEHVLFGTDFGFSAAFAPATVHDIEEVVTDGADREAIYEGNARRVLRIEAPVT